MKALVIGAGEVGFHIAAKLSLEKADVVVIDRDLERLAEVGDLLDVQTVAGRGANPRVLMEAGLAGADLVVAVTNSDETNILACRLAQMLAPKTRRIARIRSGGYFQEVGEARLGEELGISFIINPGREAVDNILDFLEVPGAADILEVAKGRLRLVGIRLNPGHPLVGKTLKESLPRGRGPSVLIAAIYRHHDLVIPTGNTDLKAGDLLYLVATPDEYHKVSQFFGLSLKPLRSVFIVGGGEVGYQLAKRLEARGGHLSIKLVEQNHDRCEFLSGALSRTIVLKGDGSDQNLLMDENVGDCDAFIAVTTDDERNMISCLLAKRLGAGQTITRVNRYAYAPLVTAIGLEALVSVRVAAVSAILKYIRRGRVVSVATLKNEDAEIIEFEVGDNAKVVGMSLTAAPFPKGAIVAALTREGAIIIPRGDTTIKVGDILVVVAKAEVIPKVEKLLVSR